jgi:hypothetical protein
MEGGGDIFPGTASTLLFVHFISSNLALLIVDWLWDNLVYGVAEKKAGGDTHTDLTYVTLTVSGSFKDETFG